MGDARRLATAQELERCFATEAVTRSRSLDVGGNATLALLRGAGLVRITMRAGTGACGNALVAAIGLA